MLHIHCFSWLFTLVRYISNDKMLSHPLPICIKCKTCICWSNLKPDSATACHISCLKCSLKYCRYKKTWNIGFDLKSRSKQSVWGLSTQVQLIGDGENLSLIYLYFLMACLSRVQYWEVRSYFEEEGKKSRLYIKTDKAIMISFMFSG